MSLVDSLEVKLSGNLDQTRAAERVNIEVLGGREQTIVEVSVVFLGSFSEYCFKKLKHLHF